MHLTEAKYWDERELYSGLIRLHILHHAQEGGFFGLGMIEELARDRYKLSPARFIRFSTLWKEKDFFVLTNA